MKYLTLAFASLLLATSATLADITQISPKRSSGTSPSIKVGEDFVLLLPNESQLTMIWCEPGSFSIGSQEDELGKGRRERKQYEVSLTEGFWLGKYEVTVEQYHAVDGSDREQKESKDNDRPIAEIDYLHASTYGKDLTHMFTRQIPNGYTFTLPTEAQWEYVCRAGTTTSLNSGEDLTPSARLSLSAVRSDCENLNEVAWYKENSDDVTHSVGKKKANAWGFYDMHGNVAEWCLDTLFDKHFTDTKIVDLVGDRGLLNRTVRGGSYGSSPSACRSASRLAHYSAVKATNEMIGFRIALTFQEEDEEETPRSKSFKGLMNLF